MKDGNSVAAAANGWRQAVAGLCLALAGHAAAATEYALLVGVSDYPNLPRRLWLQAPGNDVALMRDTLLARGYSAEHIQQLVSRAGGTREPTRGNILAAMRNVQRDARRGDQVLFYVAGHGSQQPQPVDHGSRPTEPDGLDEVFLPADTQRWDGTTADAEIPNALLDDEIGEWIDALVDDGVTVWAILDTCHAAGMARGRPARTRAVSPAELGLSDARLLGARRSAVQRSGSMGRMDGRALAFAARAQESAGEEWMPRGATLLTARLHGVFTFHLVEALKQPGHPSLDDLRRALRDAYAREHRAAPTPQFAGDRDLRLR